MAPIAFGENSDIYQKLVLKEQKVDSLNTDFEDRRDPELFLVAAKVKDRNDVDYVKLQILETYKRYTKELVAKDKLDSTRSRARYSFALSMNSSEAIAGTLATYIGLRRTPETTNKLFSVYDSITPEDIRVARNRPTFLNFNVRHFRFHRWRGDLRSRFLDCSRSPHHQRVALHFH